MNAFTFIKWVGFVFLSGGIDAFSTSCHRSLILPHQGSRTSLSFTERKWIGNNSERALQHSLHNPFSSSVSGLNMNEDDAEELRLKKSTAFLAPVLSTMLGLGKRYAVVLEKSPIMTKSLTAGFIFGLSDYVAQNLEQTNKKKKNWTRIVSALLVGLLYFGPAAHSWYEMIFRLLPGTSLISTLQKAALGQALFSPSFTCIFFASSLIQSGSFTLSNWIKKIKTDLPGAWRAGMGFWPLVDLISYSLVPPQWIPLFVNFCSFIWTIYLSTVANKRSDSKT